MTLDRLSIHWGLTICIGAVVNFTSPAVAQTAIERAAFACMQLDEESAYAKLQRLGWQRLMPVELSAEEKEVLSTEHFLFKAQRPNNPHRQQSFEETAKIATKRVEQQMARNASASDFSGGAVLRNRSTQDLVSVQTENHRKFERTSCTFFYTQQTSPGLFAHVQRNLKSSGSGNSLVARIGAWDNYKNGIEQSVEVYLWDTARISVALQREFPGELMVVASVWQHAENKKGDE